ncbi:MAG: zinc-dependent alcohol dehydrogenase family protein [Pseudomonas sp.]
MADHMRRWTTSSLGLSTLSLGDVPIPKPGYGEVLVKVAAVSLNFRDLLIIENGLYQTLTFPFVPGGELAGSVTAVGEGVTRFGTGDRVVSYVIPEWLEGPPPGDGRESGIKTLGHLYPGVLCEYVALPQDWLVAAPTSLNDVEASTLSVAGCTAWAAMVEQNDVKPGSTVVIQGTGGVALFALQIAKMLGATTIVTTSSEDKAQRVIQLGADHVIVRSAGDWADEVLRLTNGRGADHIIELVGGAGMAQSVAAVAIDGHIQIAGGLDEYAMSAPIPPMFHKRLRMQGIVAGPRRAFEDFIRAVDANHLKPIIAKRYAFDELPQALAHLKAGAFGKIVIDI